MKRQLTNQVDIIFNTLQGLALEEYLNTIDKLEKLAISSNMGTEEKKQFSTICSEAISKLSKPVNGDVPVVPHTAPEKKTSSAPKGKGDGNICNWILVSGHTPGEHCKKKATLNQEDGVYECTTHWGKSATQKPYVPKNSKTTTAKKYQPRPPVQKVSGEELQQVVGTTTKRETITAPIINGEVSVPEFSFDD